MVSQVQRYDSTRTQICKDDIMNNYLDGETCDVIETEEGQEVSTNCNYSIANMEKYDRNRSTNDGNVKSERTGSNLSSSEIYSYYLFLTLQPLNYDSRWVMTTCSRRLGIASTKSDKDQTAPPRGNYLLSRKVSGSRFASGCP